MDMERVQFSFEWQHLKKYAEQHLWMIFFITALLVALLGSVLLFHPLLTGWCVATLIGIGLDPARAQLVTALLLTAGIALISGLLVRQKSGAILGACLAFSLNYLIDFVVQQLQPQRDPGGRLEVLHTWVLVHTVLVLLALSFLSAFIGAAVGVACAEVVVTPLAQVAHNLQTRMISNPQSSSRQRRPVLWSWFAAGLLLLSLILALGSSSLFAFSPDVGIHTLSTSSNTGMPSQGTVVEDHMISPSMHGQQRSFLVYLPPSYNTPQGQTQHYPVLYLLHGSPGKDSDWLIAGKADQIEESLIAQKRIPELILILPDGNGRGGETSEWGDSGDGQQRLETCIAHDLVSYVDQKYRTLATPAFRGIGGNSMGGFGAMNIAVHHPDVFGFVIALGGYYDAEGSIWGTNKASIQANSPAVVLPQKPQAWKLHLFIGAATNDQPYYGDSLSFVRELNWLHIPYTFDVQKGYHAWSVWQTQLYHALLWVAPLLK